MAPFHTCSFSLNENVFPMLKTSLVIIKKLVASTPVCQKHLSYSFLTRKPPSFMSHKTSSTWNKSAYFKKSNIFYVKQLQALCDESRPFLMLITDTEFFKLIRRLWTNKNMNRWSINYEWIPVATKRDTEWVTLLLTFFVPRTNMKTFENRRLMCVFEFKC